MATAPFSLATDSTQFSGMNSGSNLGGGPMAGFLSPSPITGLGGTTNPFSPSMPGGKSMPPLTSPTTAPAPGAAPATSGMPAYGSPYATSGATTTLAGLSNTPASTGFTGTDLASSLQHTYYGGAGTALADFLKSGAGYNPGVAQALIAALQPQFAKGQANLMEQFGAMGLGEGSPAALAMGDYQAQSNLDVGQILAGLYEDSVQNYMKVLMGTAGQGVNEGMKLAEAAVGGLMGGGSVSSGGTSVGF